MAVAETDEGLTGFGSIGPFRVWPAYQYSGEHSLHVRVDQRCRGIGRALLRSLIDEAMHRQLRTLIGAIDTPNRASIALHERMGFVECARIRDAGYKFGRWLDLVLVQLILSGPAATDARI